MHSLQLRRQVVRWLIPLISLWVVIICALAFYGAAVAKEAPPEYWSEAQRARYQRDEPAAAALAPPDLWKPASPAEVDLPLIDPDPGLADSDLLPDRVEVAAPELPLYVDRICQTPMSLMLHSSFGHERMVELANEIVARGFITTTYREVSEGLRRGECPRSDELIVSLDDFGTDWLRAHFQSMIEPFVDRGLQLVIAVNVRGPQDPDAWIYLRQLEGLGHEVANHTMDHLNLARLEPGEIAWQIKGAHQIVCVNLGRCPETLILPFGIIDQEGLVETAANGYNFIVGIPGGREFGGETPYYLGRIGPAIIGQRETLNELTATFNLVPSPSEEWFSVRTVAGRGCAAGPSPARAMRLALCSTSASSDTSLEQPPAQ